MRCGERVCEPESHAGATAAFDVQQHARAPHRCDDPFVAWCLDGGAGHASVVPQWFWRRNAFIDTETVSF